MGISGGKDRNSNEPLSHEVWKNAHASEPLSFDKFNDFNRQHPLLPIAIGEEFQLKIESSALHGILSWKSEQKEGKDFTNVTFHSMEPHNTRSRRQHKTTQKLPFIATAFEFTPFGDGGLLVELQITDENDKIERFPFKFPHGIKISNVIKAKKKKPTAPVKKMKEIIYQKLKAGRTLLNR